MRVNLIMVRLEGKHDLSKLKELGFRHHEGKWLFQGKLHRYTFVADNDGHVTLLISPRPPDWRTDPTSGTPHEITFRNFPDWIMKCVDTIQEAN